MIYYWLHILYIITGSRFFWKKVDLASDLTRIRKVNVLDCDAINYMANSKYFYYMDFIRLEIMFRSDLYENTMKKRIYPVIGSQKIIYKKPLKRGTRFSITLVVEGWDDKWVYHRQVFKQNDEVCAIGFTKVGFWKRHKIQEMRTILVNSGIGHPEMEVDPKVMAIFDNDTAILKNT